MKRFWMIMMLVAGCAGAPVGQDEPAQTFPVLPPPPECTIGQSESCAASDGRTGVRFCLGLSGLWSPCLADSYCGDGTCDASDLETRENCEDCHDCGDGFCDYTEDAPSCPADCQECVPDQPYCDGSVIRLCTSDGGASVKLEDCATSAGSGPFATCIECPSTGALDCGSPVPLVTGTMTGTLDATPFTFFERLACPGEVWADTAYDPDDGLSIEVMLTTGEWLSIWIGYWGLYNGYVHTFSWGNVSYPYLEIHAWDQFQEWRNHAQCWWCTPPPGGSFVVEWLGDLETGAIVHAYGSGSMTADYGFSWSPFAFNLYLLVL
jgi:hypothetical protein